MGRDTAHRFDRKQKKMMSERVSAHREVERLTERRNEKRRKLEKYKKENDRERE